MTGGARAMTSDVRAAAVSAAAVGATETIDASGADVTAGRATKDAGAARASGTESGTESATVSNLAGVRVANAPARERSVKARGAPGATAPATRRSRRRRHRRA